MASYRILFERRAVKELRQLTPEIRQRLLAAIMKLAVSPRPAQARPLALKPGWRLRVGNYRVIYTIENQQLIITIIRAAHRKDIYR